MSAVIVQRRMPTGQVLQVRQGDLTQEDADAIVNAANSRLAHGGGVAGAIIRHGGQEIQKESDRLIREYGIVPTGQVAVTGPGSLPARHIIHAVGPIWRGGTENEEELLRQAVWNSLAKAHEMKLVSIAMPAISSGIFGFPKVRCAQILIQAAQEFLAQHPETSLREVRFTNFDDPTVEIFRQELEKAPE